MIEKILKDWKKRVGNNLNYKNTDHLFELGSMLTEQGWDSETIGILIENLKEIDIVRKKQPDGSFGSAYTVKKHNPDRGQQLVKKDASPEDLDKVDKGEPIDTDDEESIDDLIQADHQSADDSLNMTINLNIKYTIRTGDNLENIEIINKVLNNIHIGKIPIIKQLL